MQILPARTGRSLDGRARSTALGGISTGANPVTAPLQLGIMSSLIRIQDIDQFSEVVSVPEGAVTADVLAGVRQLDERCNLEPMLRDVLWDPTETPHGPTEIADILSAKVLVRGKPRLAAFVVKGKSFVRVRAEHIAHQVLRLRTLPGLGLIVLVAVGHIQDNAQRDFIQVVRDANCDYLIVEAIDCARLLVAYEKICPTDGTPYGPEGTCKCGHKQDDGTMLTRIIREGADSGETQEPPCGTNAVLTNV